MGTRAARIALTPPHLELTEEQTDVLHTVAPCLLIEAAAGSGKTTTLAAEVANQLLLGASPDDILCLTHSAAARDVLRQRVLQMGCSKVDVERITFLTFEELALQVLRSFFDDLWVLALPDQKVRIEVPFLATPELLRPKVMSAIERVRTARAEFDLWRTSNWEIERFLAAARRAKATLAFRIDSEIDGDEEDAAASMQMSTSQLILLRAYERSRQYSPTGSTSHRGEGDAVYDLAIKLLQDFHHVVSLLPKKSHLVIDEAHDWNAATFMIIRGLVAASATKRMLCVGDVNQVIAQDIGADARFMGPEFSTAFPGSKRLPLTRVFRCSGFLAEAAGRVVGRPYTGPRTRKTTIEAYEASSPDDVCRRVTDLAKSVGDHDSRLVVLIDRSAHAISIEHHLIEAGIGYSVRGLEAIQDRLETQFLLGVLGYLEAGSHLQIKSQKVEGVTEALAIVLGINRDDAFEGIGGGVDFRRYLTSWLGSQKPHLLSKFESAVQRYRPEDPAFEILDRLLQEIGFRSLVSAAYVRADDSQNALASFDALLRHARSKKFSCSAFIASILAQDALARRSTTRRVEIWSIAEAKGNEFPWVVIPFADHDTFDKARRDADTRNLFYVAITRVRDRLSIVFEPHRKSRHVLAMDLNRDPLQLPRT